MLLSIVIPLLNEQESIQELYSGLNAALQKKHLSYEVIFIDDGSTDESWTVIKSLKEHHANIKAIRFSKNYGKSQALHAGFKLAQGDVVATMDADLQDQPNEIPEMIEMLQTENLDLVS